MNQDQSEKAGLILNNIQENLKAVELARKEAREFLSSLGINLDFFHSTQPEMALKIIVQIGR